MGYSGFDENPEEEEYAKEEGESGEHERPQRPQLNMTKVKHHCGNMFRGRKEGKVVEPLNFFTPLAIKNC